MTAFSRKTFSEAMRYFRKHNKLSQIELSDQLSRSHALFQNVSQSMVSHWERGNVEPSLLRRLGMAHFFSQPYHYDQIESGRLQKALRYREEFLGDRCLYEYPISKKDIFSWDALPASLKEMIARGHKNTFSTPIEVVLRTMNITAPSVLCLLHGSAVVGHALFTVQGNVFKLASYGAVSKSARHELTKAISDLSCSYELYTVVRSSSLEQYLKDIYMRKVTQLDALSFYRGMSSQVFENPFSHFNLYDAADFRLMRYSQMRDEAAEPLF